MAGANHDLSAEVAETLLKAIGDSAESYRAPDHLRSLAEAYAQVVQNDVKRSEPPREVHTL